MAPRTPRPVVTVDLKKQPREQKLPLHNRWHPEIPPVATVKTGEIFRIEMVDWTGGAIKENNSAADVKALDLSPVSKNFIYSNKNLLPRINVNSSLFFFPNRRFYGLIINIYIWDRFTT